MSLGKPVKTYKLPLSKKKPKKGHTSKFYDGEVVNTKVRKKTGRGTRKQEVGKPPKFRSEFEKEFWKENHTKMNLRYEPFRISYSIVEERTYTPDFVYTDPFLKTNPYTVYETKGHWQPKDRKKMLHVKRTNPGLKIVMVFQRDNWITKAKKNKYSDWCIKNQIDFCIGTDLSKIVYASNPNRELPEEYKRTKKA